MGSDLGKIISSFGNFDLNFGGSAGAMAKVGEQVVSLFSGGEGDSSVFSKASEVLGNLKANVHQGLGNFMQSDFVANAGNALQGIASTIDGLEIPETIHNGISKIRDWVCESGVVGDVAKGALNIFYGVGSNMPAPIGTIVGAMSQVIKPESVEKIIDNTLMHVEKSFFEQMDAEGSAYTAFRKQVYETLSCQNIVEVTMMMAQDVLETTYAATGPDATPEQILSLVKKNAAEYLETELVKDGTVLIKEKTLPVLKDGVKYGVETVSAIAEDSEIRSEGSAMVKGLPGLMTTAGQAMWQSISGLGKFF